MPRTDRLLPSAPGPSGPGGGEGGDSAVHAEGWVGGLPLAVIGVSHHTAPVDVRERMAFDRQEATAALDRLRHEQGIREAVLLSTCNRTELYLVPGAGEREFRAAEAMLAAQAHTDPDDLERYLFRARGDAVVHHLFEVTAGLDSLVLGEAEIQGQVREAFEIAGGVSPDHSVVGPVLHRLFEMALAVGGRVRSQTRLGEGSASVASVAVELARKIFGPLRGRRALILGAGATAELTVRALAREGVRGGVVVNRTLERAETLARQLGAEAVPLEDLPRALRTTDMVVASTAARTPVITREVMAAAFPNGVSRPFLVVDIAIPRDVEPGVGDLPNVFLYNVDDLRDIIDDHLQKRSDEVPEARRLIVAQQDEFRRWFQAREAAPLIRSLRARAEGVRRAETDRLLRRMGHLEPEDRERLEAFTRRLMNKLLHDPTVVLRDGVGGADGDDLIGAVRKMYGLDEHGVRDHIEGEDG